MPSLSVILNQFPRFLDVDDEASNERGMTLVFLDLFGQILTRTRPWCWECLSSEFVWVFSSMKLMPWIERAVIMTGNPQIGHCFLSFCFQKRALPLLNPLGMKIRGILGAGVRWGDCFLLSSVIFKEIVEVSFCPLWYSRKSLNFLLVFCDIQGNLWIFLFWYSRKSLNFLLLIFKEIADISCCPLWYSRK